LLSSLVNFIKKNITAIEEKPYFFFKTLKNIRTWILAQVLPSLGR
jgi:hypothetical protein